MISKELEDSKKRLKNYQVRVILEAMTHSNISLVFKHVSTKHCNDLAQHGCLLSGSKMCRQKCLEMWVRGNWVR